MQRTATVTIPTAVDPALGVKQEMVDRELVLRGTFDSEIKRLEKIKSEAEEKAGIVDTVQKAQAIRDEADAYAAKTRAEADAMMAEAGRRQASAESVMGQAMAREQKAQAREKELEGREAALTAGLGSLEQARKHLGELEREQDRNNKEIVFAFEKRASETRAQLAQQSANLAAREKRLNERLDALRITDI